MIFKNENQVVKRKSQNVATNRQMGSQSSMKGYRGNDEDNDKSEYSVITRVTKNTLLKNRDKVFMRSSVEENKQKFIKKRISASQFCVIMSLMFLVFLVTFILLWIFAALFTPSCPSNENFNSQNLLMPKPGEWHLIYANEGNFLIPNTTETFCAKQVITQDNNTL